MPPHPLPDPATQLAGIEHWLAALRARGLGDAVRLTHLQTILEQAHGERVAAPMDPLLLIMLCGPTAVGKSRLLNAIAGTTIAQPGLGATTHTAVLYVHAHDDLARLFDYGERIGQWAQHPHTVIRHQHDALRHKVLVDTPDIDSAIQQHQALTAALVQSADLVLFVTSPEKYNTMQAAHWVAQQRQQRALAFVLHKWDREGIGLQYAQRDRIVQDFRRLLRALGFAAPILFTVSSQYASAPQPQAPAAAEDTDNQLPALQAWIATGLHDSLANTIQQRRRRAAWGRVAAAVAAVLPTSISTTPWVHTALTALANTHADAHRLVQASIDTIVVNHSDRTIWPTTPGLFGIYTRFLAWCSTLGTGWRRVGEAWRAWAPPPHTSDETVRALPAPPDAAGIHGDFGESVTRLLADVTRRLLTDLATTHLSLQPVRLGWSDTVMHLRTQLSLLPTHVDQDLMTQALQPSLRRRAGVAVLYGVEGLLTLFLVVVLWRVGEGFLLGTYTSVALLLNATTLFAALILGGHLSANLFFPSLQQRFRNELTRRALAAVDTAWETTQDVLQEHVAAVDQLITQGCEILQSVEQHIQALMPPVPEEEQIPRLFGDVDASEVETVKPQEATLRLPRFE